MITKPTPERLIPGAHLIAESIYIDRWTYAGVVTRVSGKRVYFIPWRLSRRDGWEVDGIERHIYTQRVKAIADGNDEAHEFCLKWSEASHALYKKHCLESSELNSLRNNELLGN